MEYTRESIFFASVRSFFKAFGALLGIFAAIMVFAILFLFSEASQCNTPDKSKCTILPDAEGNTTMLSTTDPAILHLDIHGVIGLNEMTAKLFAQTMRDSREDFLGSNRVKGIILHIDTPGGTVTDADDIYRTLLAYKKKYNVPIYAYIDGICASGGMYIASAADKIFASPSSMIGSVGVLLGPNFNFSSAMDKVGISSMTMTRGIDKDMLNPFRPWKQGEDASLQAVITHLYNRFVDIVTHGRPQMSREKLVNEYGAQVFDSDGAQQRGYIDVADTDYDSALTELVKAAQIHEGQKYQVVQLEPTFSVWSQLSQGSLSIFNQFWPDVLKPQLRGKLLYLYQ